MKSSEIRELSAQELQERLESEETLLVRMKMNHAVSPLDNPFCPLYSPVLTITWSPFLICIFFCMGNDHLLCYNTSGASETIFI